MIRLFLIFCLCLLPQIAAAELPAFRATYTADGWAQIDSTQVSGRVVQDGTKARIDARSAPHSGSVILDLAGQQATIFGSFLPDAAVRIAYGGVAAIPDFDTLSWLSPSRVGTDDIEGETAGRYALQGTAPDGSPVTGTLWVTDDGIPVAGVFNSGARRRHTVQFRLSGIERTANQSAFSTGGLQVSTVDINELQALLKVISLAGR